MKNDKRRITAEERVYSFCQKHSIGALGGPYSYQIPREVFQLIIKMLGDHVKAAHKRHARKNVCFRPGQKGFDVVKDYRDKLRRNPPVDE